MSTSLPEIERRGDLTPAEFTRQYAAAHRPVILTGATAGWQALQKWTPEFFRETYGDRTISFQRGEVKERNLAEFIDLVTHSSAAQPAPYWTNNPIAEIFPELLADLQPLPPYVEPNWGRRSFLHPGMGHSLNRGAKIELYIGGAGGAFPVLHWDGLSSHAFLMQIYGRKKYWAWAPDQSELLYASKNPPNLSPIGDVEHPDLEKYPRFAEARGMEFYLNPGEILFVPSRWWHTAKMEETSITVSINVVNQTNWANFTEDMLRNASGPASLFKRIYLAASGLKNRLQG